jgi:hypothetical protein
MRSRARWTTVGLRGAEAELLGMSGPIGISPRTERLRCTIERTASKIQRSALDFQGIELVPRLEDEHRLREALSRAPVVLLTGPRQAGKSTLARQVADIPASSFFDHRRAPLPRCDGDPAAGGPKGPGPAGGAGAGPVGPVGSDRDRRSPTAAGSVSGATGPDG